MADTPLPEAIRTEWLRRVEAEYRSACVTQELTLWLMQIAASPDLLTEGLRIAGDELVHAELSMEAYLEAGGTSAPTLPRETLSLQRHRAEPLEHDVIRVGLDVFCLGETVAVPLFKNLREGCTAPVARRALDRILVDEVRHRDFGWSLLQWMLEQPAARDYRALIELELPSCFARIRTVYAATAGRAAGVQSEVSAVATEWGLMSVKRYAEVVQRTMERDWRPRFAELQIDADRAWDESVRIAP